MIEFNKIFDNFPISFGFFQTQRSTDIAVVGNWRQIKWVVSNNLLGGRCCHISGNGILCCWIELNIMLLLLRLIIIYKHFYENIYLCSKLSLVQSMKPYLSKSVYWKIRPRPSLKSAYGFLKMHKAQPYPTRPIVSSLNWIKLILLRERSVGQIIESIV